MLETFSLETINWSFGIVHQSSEKWTKLYEKPAWIGGGDTMNYSNEIVWHIQNVKFSGRMFECHQLSVTDVRKSPRPFCPCDFSQTLSNFVTCFLIDSLCPTEKWFLALSTKIIHRFPGKFPNRRHPLNRLNQWGSGWEVEVPSATWHEDYIVLGASDRGILNSSKLFKGRL